jgi:hypothetical protein
MVSVGDVGRLIAALGDVVKSTREIVEAVRDGRAFLASRHPGARTDFAELLRQMGRTIEGLASVTRVIGGFRFTTDGTTVNLRTAERDLARFNKAVMAQRAEAARLRNDIRKLKSDCDRVAELRDKLDAQAGSRPWSSMWGLLGVKARRRAAELSGTLSNFYADDRRMIDLISGTLKLAERGIKDVEKALGPPGTADPWRVPEAAAILGTFAVLFEKPQEELQGLADELSRVEAELRP